MSPEHPQVVVVNRGAIPHSPDPKTAPGVFVTFMATGTNSPNEHFVHVFIPVEDLSEVPVDEDPIERLHDVFLDAAFGALDGALGKSKMEASPR